MYSVAEIQCCMFEHSLHVVHHCVCLFVHTHTGSTCWWWGRFIRHPWTRMTWIPVESCLFLFLPETRFMTVRLGSNWLDGEEEVRRSRWVNRNDSVYILFSPLSLFSYFSPHSLPLHFPSFYQFPPFLSHFSPMINRTSGRTSICPISLFLSCLCRKWPLSATKGTLRATSLFLSSTWEVSHPPHFSTVGKGLTFFPYV